eukprot:1191424-Prorocentrum_minimum.AAC.8
MAPPKITLIPENRRAAGRLCRARGRGFSVVGFVERDTRRLTGVAGGGAGDVGGGARRAGGHQAGGGEQAARGGGAEPTLARAARGLYQAGESSSPRAGA